MLTSVFIDRKYDNWGLGMVEHVFNPSTWEGEAAESQVPGQPGLHSHTLSQKNMILRFCQVLSEN
jgi:hypothetical protein